MNTSDIISGIIFGVIFLMVFIGYLSASQFYSAKNDPSLKEYQSCLREYVND